MNHRWSPEEDAQLRLITRLGCREMKYVFPHLAYSQIRGRAYRLGLKIPKVAPRRDHARRGKTPIPPHAHPLVRKLIEHANRQKLFLYEISDRAGIARTAVSQWRYVRNPSLTGLIAALNVMDLDLAIIVKRDKSLLLGEA